MSVRIIADEDGAVFYCSTSMIPFGLVMQDQEVAEEFRAWLPQDARIYKDQELEDKYYEFLKTKK
jgi:hypothetical protein